MERLSGVLKFVGLPSCSGRWTPGRLL